MAHLMLLCDRCTNIKCQRSHNVAAVRRVSSICCLLTLILTYLFIFNWNVSLSQPYLDLFINAVPFIGFILPEALVLSTFIFMHRFNKDAILGCQSWQNLFIISDKLLSEFFIFLPSYQYRFGNAKSNNKNRICYSVYMTPLSRRTKNYKV